MSLPMSFEPGEGQANSISHRVVTELRFFLCAADWEDILLRRP